MVVATNTPAAPAIKTSKNSAVRKLITAVQFADKHMDGFRRRSHDYAGQFVGPYASWEPDKAEPVNLIYSLIQTIMPLLVIDPEAVVDTGDIQLRAFADLFALKLNKTVKQLRLRETLEEAIQAGFFGPSVLYTGLCGSPSDIGTDDVNQDAGQPFVDFISVDDYFYDPFATRQEAMLFEGHKMRVGREWALSQRGLFKTQYLERLAVLGEDNVRREKRTSEIGHPNPGSENPRALDQLQLRSLYIPSLGAVVTLPGDLDDAPDEFLSESEWTGLDEGPYDHLVFMRAPDNVIGVGLVGVIYDLHQALNRLWRKALRQGERGKTVGIYPLEDPKAGATILAANDGDLIGLPGGKQNVGELTMGGMNDLVLKAIGAADAWANKIAGNPDAIGGLSQQSDTATQDQMLYANASAKLAYWRNAVLRLARNVMRKLAFFEWDDPHAEAVLTQRVEGGVDLPRAWTPDAREGRFEDYTISCREYSFAVDTPERAYQRTIGWVRDLVIPLAPIAAQSGMTLDVGTLLSTTGKQANVPHADEMLRPMRPEIMPGMAGGQVPGGNQPTNTTVNVGTPRPQRMGNAPEVEAQQPAMMQEQA